MARPRSPRRRSVSRTAVAEHHLTWVQALPGDGPFLTIPVLTEALPNGLEETDPDRAAAFKFAYASYRTAPTSEQESARQKFIATTARDVLDWGDHFDSTASTSGEYAHTSAAFDVTTTPAFALWPISRGEDDGAAKPTFLGFVWPHDTALNRRLLDGWAATPIDRVAATLRHHDIPLGIVTNARTWVIVWAPRGSATGWVLFDTHAMLDDRQLLDAFTTLLSRRRHLAVADTETLNALLNRALQSQEELTENLSIQVRQAVEMLVDAVGRADHESRGQVLAGVDADHVYQGAVTIVMRLVFLLAAEERKLLPGDDDIWIANYGIAGLADRLIETAHRQGEEILARQAEAFPQILATSRIVHDGVRHQTLNIKGYGGSVFDPGKHPWLEGAQPGGPGKPVHVDDRTLLHILTGLTRWQGRRLAYRTLDVEQIGYVYEGLLDHTALRAAEPTLGLRGKHEPEITLNDLETQAARGSTQLAKWLKDRTGLSPSQITRALDTAPPDADQERLLLAACAGDSALAARIAPYFALVRTDERSGQPIVCLPGDWYVTRSEARSGSGAFYTPRSLAEEVVKHTLDALVYNPGSRETLNEDEWKIVPPDVILGLSVADVAMGSGAFLVAANRYLAERLIEAITVHGAASSTDPALIDLARTVTTHTSDVARQVDSDADEATLTARRLIATRVLYGADINPTAVEMAKLSLWLSTAARDQPFGFLDHHLVTGDSLLGLTDVRQLEYVHPDPRRGQALRTTTWLDQVPWHIQSALQHAMGQREALERIRVQDLRDVEQQQAILVDVQHELADLTLFADAITAEIFAAAQNKNRFLDEYMSIVASQAGVLLDKAAPVQERDAAREWARACTERLNQTRPAGGFERHPIQWVLKFPEVFQEADRPGFDAVIGNPPYLGGQRITGGLGTDYRNYLAEGVAEGRRGSADLVIYFLLRTTRLSKSRIGLLTTNTAAQGDSRQVGLDHLTMEQSWRIMRAVRSEKWPSRSANLEYSAIYLDQQATDNLPAVLDGNSVKAIGPDLRIASRVSGTPHRLAANQGIAFQGSIVLGLGFTLTQAEAERMIAADPRNAEVIYPYLNGKDLNTSPTQAASRWVINFFDWTEERAATYPLAFERVERLVKPERARNNRRVRREQWWTYAEPAKGLYAAIADLDQVIAITLVSSVVQPVRVATGQVFAHKLAIFACSTPDVLGLLSSAIHGEWARRYASSLETRVNYSPSDVFDTFPQPEDSATLSTCGLAIESARNDVMSGHGVGLTATYNLVNDSSVEAEEVVALREAHVELDRAVLATYGWSDLEPGHGFFETEQGVRFAMDPLVTAEVLDRLLELNHARYADEVSRGLHGKQGASGQLGSRKRAATDGEGEGDAVLFE